ncbi:hypothetical protein SKP08_002109 [Vibrio fluvialis]|nr:hypothetical protein [Vibrio fluvialis]
MPRISVFLAAGNDKGHVQAVISSEDAEYFKAAGFVMSVDEVKKPAAKKTASQDKKAVADGGNTN